MGEWILTVESPHKAQTLNPRPYIPSPTAPEALVRQGPYEDCLEFRGNNLRVLGNDFSFLLIIILRNSKDCHLY